MIGSRIGGYEILSLLDVGGMGEVYRARDTKLGRDVAIKVLPSSLATDPDRLARFAREARLLAALNHPHIATIHGLEEAEGAPALVMELVEGPTLAETLASGSRRTEKSGLPLAEALRIAGQIAEALDAAHEKGIVHRDLKPANVKLTHDRLVKVLDFGLAKAFSSDGTSRDVTQLPTIMASNLGWRDCWHAGLHESRAGARPGGGQAHRHLVVRLRALRNDHGSPVFFRPDGLGHDRSDPGTPAGLERVASRDTAKRSACARTLPGKGCEATLARHRRRARRARRCGRCTTTGPGRS